MAVLGHATSFSYHAGILCYTTVSALRILDLNDRFAVEKVLSNDVFADHLACTTQGRAAGIAAGSLKSVTLQGYAEDVVTVVCDFGGGYGSYLFAVNVSDTFFDDSDCLEGGGGEISWRRTGDRDRLSLRILLCTPLRSTCKIFVRHSARWLVVGTHSAVGIDEHHEWLLQRYDLVSGKPVTKEPLQLRGFFGSDIGSTVCFCVFGGDKFYAIANQTSFESEEVDWTSYYQVVTFDIADENPDLTVQGIWRRQHLEGPINDAWTDLGFQIDARTGELLIVECRKEWVDGGSRSIRTYYTQVFERAKMVDLRPGGRGGVRTHPPGDPLSRTLDGKSNSRWEVPNVRIGRYVHAEFPLASAVVVNGDGDGDGDGGSGGGGGGSGSGTDGDTTGGSAAARSAGSVGAGNGSANGGISGGGSVAGNSVGGSTGGVDVGGASTRGWGRSAGGGVPSVKEYIRAKTKWNGYHFNAQCFVDLVTEEVRVEGEWRPKERIKLRVVSRDELSPLIPDPEQAGTGRLVVRSRVKDRDDCEMEDGEEAYSGSRVYLWPPDDGPQDILSPSVQAASQELSDILCPGGRAGEVKATLGDEGIVYMAGPVTAEGGRALVFIGFDPTFGFDGMKRLDGRLALAKGIAVGKMWEQGQKRSSVEVEAREYGQKSGTSDQRVSKPQCQKRRSEDGVDAQQLASRMKRVKTIEGHAETSSMTIGLGLAGDSKHIAAAPAVDAITILPEAQAESRTLMPPQPSMLVKADSPTSLSPRDGNGLATASPSRLGGPTDTRRRINSPPKARKFTWQEKATYLNIKKGFWLR